MLDTKLDEKISEEKTLLIIQTLIKEREKLYKVPSKYFDSEDIVLDDNQEELHKQASP